MLTNEQCIEVVEKVWGLVKHSSLSGTWARGQDINVPVKYLINLKTWNLAELQEEVNSWQGFGRTVEAMAGKQLDPMKKFRFTESIQRHVGRFINKAINAEDLFELGNLSALEAVKDE